VPGGAGVARQALPGEQQRAHRQRRDRARTLQFLLGLLRLLARVGFERQFAGVMRDARGK